eukprot:TRINITY_DN1504_c0_g2_i2.p1 TRINITY_DN1504_c0_g2~~TRINITY_DN1504_c0_g2_i2.p1  ORF type:complete len:479 (+),score=176.82 TRINITY_DN1504_c0_g2_i2:877-2313(+)
MADVVPLDDNAEASGFLVTPKPKTSVDDDQLDQRPATRWEKLKAQAGQHLLLILTIGGVVCGVIAGAIMQAVRSSVSDTAITLVGFPGELLLRMLKMLVLPLISASVITGITSLSQGPNSAQSTKRIIIRMLVYFLGTTLLAVVLGIVLTSVIQPGQFSTPATDSKPIEPKQPTSALDAILNVFRSLVPENLVASAANLDILGIITFSMVLGATIVYMGPSGDPLLRLFESLNEAVMKIVMMVMWFAPVGIMSLIAARLGGSNDFVGLFRDLAMFGVTVLLGLSVHLFVLLPAIYFAVLRRNPFKFYIQLLQPIATAFGTDSSAATLPVSMKCVRATGISGRIVQVVLPLGVTLNMNGTALYEAVAALFVAQLHDVQLDVGQTIVVALTSTLAAVGAAGIPEAGLITMTIVFTAVDLPLTDIALLFTIDWFLDRCRTVVNVLGDAVGAAIIDHYYRKENPEAVDAESDSVETYQAIPP